MVMDVDPTKEDGMYKAGSVAKDLDLMAADFPEREYQVYELLRTHLPVCRPESLRGAGVYQDGQPGAGWFFSRYEDVAYAFRHPEIFSSQIGLPFIPQGVDPPEHTEYRKFMNPWFSQQAIAPVEPRVRALAGELADKMLAKDEFDFVKEFAEPFPTIIFCELMGLPMEDVPRMMRWKDLFVHGVRAGKAAELGIPTDDTGHPQIDELRKVLVGVTQEMYAYFRKLIEARRREPQDDLLTRLIEARYADERPLTDGELLQTLHLFVLGGLDTVTGSLSSIMLFLAEHPDKRSEFIGLMDDPERASTAVEELVRYTSIVSPARRVTQACTYRGLQLNKGDMVVLSTPSANRDERVFENSAEVIFERHPNPHLGFALGPHRCLGMQLARRELTIALQEVHRRMPDYAIKPGDKADVYGGGVKGVARIPLVVQKGSGLPR